MGWRYLLFTLGGLTLFLWGLRFFLFSLLESPRYLIGLGKDAEAVAVIHKMADFNATTCCLTVDQLIDAGRNADGAGRGANFGHKVLSKSSVYNLSHIKALFATPKMAWSTSLLIALWGESVRIFHEAIHLDIDL